MKPGSEIGPWLRSFKNMEQIISLSKKLISIKSVEGNPKALGEALELVLPSLKDYTIERFSKNGVQSALVYNTKARPSRFKIILNGHLDVIPGKESQYIPRVKGNKLFGAGSMDMKANVACLIEAFKTVANKVKYPLALQLTTDEEIGGFDGTKYQIEKGVRADFVLAGEPTNFDIVNKAKGVLWLKVSALGKTAHGAYPWRGESAVWKMQNFLEVLKKKFPLPKQQVWATTINVSRIETKNQAINKIPDECSVWLDIRFIPEEAQTILKKIRALVPRGFKMEVLANEPALFTPQNNTYVKTLEKLGKDLLHKKILLRGAQGTSDARHFRRVNCPGIEFGPIGGGIGSDGEWVDIPSLGKYSQILQNFLLKIQEEI